MWPLASAAPPLPDPIVVAAPALLPARASRWSPGTPPGVWRASALPVSFVLGTPAPRDVGAAVAGDLDVALRTWEAPRCSGFRGRYAGVDPGRAAGDDGVNVVFVHDDAWPVDLTPGAVAQTVIHLDASGAIHDADVHLNAFDFRFSLDGRAGTLDARSILVHELGHALGLGHSNDPRATMATNGSGLRWRSLEADDVAGVCALYPGAGAPGCETAPCPDGFVCVARACQRLGDAKDVCAPCDPDATTAGACEAAGDDARCLDPGLAGAASSVAALPGSVCGRSCAADADCGAGFACARTTAAGDLQCVSRDGCRSAASPCQSDADCKDARCASGACVGRSSAADAGASAVPSGDAGAVTTPSLVAGGGGACSCRAGAPSGAAAGGALAALAAFVAFARRRRR